MVLPRSPEERKYSYTFDSFARTVEAFVVALGLKRYAIYVFDYDAPVGYHLAVAHPERVTAIVSQNGNAYELGLSDVWGPIQKYRKEPTQENRDALRHFLTFEGTKWQYTHGVADPSVIAPESYTLDAALLERPNVREIQLDIFLSYDASNVALYPTFQKYFRESEPPFLAIWGKNDSFLLPAGAKAYRRDNPNVTVKLLDTGHFALETHVEEIADEIHQFLNGIRN